MREEGSIQKTSSLKDILLIFRLILWFCTATRTG